MVLDEIKEIRSNKKELRDFGIVIGIALLILGVINFKNGHALYQMLFTGSGLFFFFGLLFPIVLLPLQKMWMIIAVCMGWIVSRVILSVLFYVVFTIISFSGKLFGKYFLDLKIEKNQKSYWIYRKESEFLPESCEKQF